MASIKVVVGAALAAFLAVNIVGAVALLSGASAFDRASDVAERYLEDDDPREYQARQVEYRDDDSDDDSHEDFDGGEFQAPRQGFSEEFGGPPAWAGGKGKGGGGAGEIAYAVERASISGEEAEDIARNEVSGQIVETKLKGKDGFPHYEIQVFDGEGQLHEILVEAGEGSVTGRKLEDPEDSYKMSYLLDRASITREEAANIATDAYPGRVVENKLDDEDGFAVYEIETFDEGGGYLHEVEVNAQNGEILSYETKGGA